MAYTHNVSGDRPSKIKSELRGLATVNNAQTSINELPTLHFYELEPAEVIDIIIDDSHPDFKTYEDIGKVKVRLLYSGPQDDVDGSKCPWAKSLDSNIKNFPLKHEIVITGHYIALEATAEISEFADPITAPKVLYYFSRLNTLNSVNHNAMLNISFIKAEERGGNYDETETGNANKNENKELELGDTFKDDNNIHPLKYYEGDIIYEGRTGQSIRFGSTDASGKDPTLKIRVGQNPDETDEQLKPIDEDINKDLNSI
ncbi:MAG: hypothetical protein ISS28_05195 [Candidatus Cloacimonetes bacterium]|nr:hypothetical protein [Actinomycetota bacterium]MBL7086477.1 hypothetical protein [Candidatus Cloacimonadota bacterium]